MDYDLRNTNNLCNDSPELEETSIVNEENAFFANNKWLGLCCLNGPLWLVAYEFDFDNKGAVYPGCADNPEVGAKYEPNIYIFLTSLTRNLPLN